MNKINEYLVKIRAFLISEDEEGFKKYLNLIIAGAVLLLLLILIIALWPAQKDNTLILNPDDTNQTKEEIPFEENQAVAVSPSTKNALSNERSTPPKESPFGTQRQTQPATPSVNRNNNSTETSANEETAEKSLVNENASENSPHEIFLLCDAFKSENQAAERKANIAFTTGFISQIVFEDNAYRVLVGPFSSRNEAIRAFNKMDDAALADECKIK